MADPDIELTDERLGAYADGETEEVEKRRIERLLVRDAAARRRLNAIRAVTSAVRAARGRDEAPAEATTEAATEVRSDLQPRPALPRVLAGWGNWRIAAAFVAGAAVLLSVVSIGSRFDGGDSDWRDSALAFHDMYLRAQESQPPDAMIDIVQHRPDELARLIDFAPSMPDLGAHGYEPAGAHVLAAPQGSFVYVLFDAKERPPVGFAMARRRAGPAASDLDEAVVRATSTGLRLVSWSAGSFEYVLSAELPAADLLELADTVRQSLSSESL